MDTTKANVKANRRARRAEQARQRRFNAEIDKSDRIYEANQRKERRQARLRKKIEASRKRSEKRKELRAQIAEKEGVSPSRVVWNGAGIEYTIKTRKRAKLAIQKQKERKIRQEKFDRRKNK